MTTIIEQDSVGPFFLNRDSPVKENAPNTHQYFPTIQNGLDYLLGHIEPPIWPRTISTYTTEGRQVLVYNKEETVARFKQANLLDCKINAYPDYVEYKGTNRQAPNFLFIDLDLCHFNSMKAFNIQLNKILANIHIKFHDDNIQPSVILSGNGCHIYLPVHSFILESESIFSEFEEPSRKLMQWTEQYLSNYKADPCHSNSLSFKNCLVRVPGSYNSKLCQLNDKGEIVNIPGSAEVKVLQKWNGVKPSIKPLLYEFYIYLADSKIMQIHRDRKRLKSKYFVGRNNGITLKTLWIEKLLQIPLNDHRKFAIRLIFAPYFINFRGISYNTAFDMIKDWLGKCNSTRRLDFKADRYIEEKLEGAKRVGYFYVTPDRIKAKNRAFYDLLKMGKII